MKTITLSAEECRICLSAPGTHFLSECEGQISDGEICLTNVR